MLKDSTGPRTEAGKERASRNAVRHGLTAETVIEPLEDAEDYQAFEEAVAAGFDAETAVERELILRLASLLWRLRRATSIETALFQIKIEHDSGPQPASELSPSPPTRVVGIHVAPAYIRPRDDVGVAAYQYFADGNARERNCLGVVLSAGDQSHRRCI